jgi:D-alanyl-D-alanine carboxypeptidase
LELKAQSAPLNDSAEKLEAIEKELGAVFAKLDCPGAYVGCFDTQGRKQWLFEFADSSRVHQGLRELHHVRIASVSKLFIGRGILLAVDYGKIRLDDSIGRWVPNVPGGDIITLRMLGQHTSGLTEPIASIALQNAIMDSPGKDWSIDELLPYCFDQVSKKKIGEDFCYSNANVLLLARVLEITYQAHYREIIQRQTLVPWNLKNTGYAPGELPPPPRQSFRFGKPRRVIGFGSTFYDVTEYGSGWACAAGDMFSTVSDLAIAVPKLATGEGLSELTRQELHHWQPAWDGTQYGYLLENLDGWVGHTGNIPGYNVAAHYHPEKHLSILAATNLSNCSDKRMPAEELAKKARVLVDSWAEAR